MSLLDKEILNTKLVKFKIGTKTMQTASKLHVHETSAPYWQKTEPSAI